ncbi:glycosyltransferase [Neptuniibacter sp. PT8_73]|uniref:glycosyltransferase n=1 Tax=unclassified Neptuniibacter TaxID=2630693 RepID=UPI0039F6710A
MIFLLDLPQPTHGMSSVNKNILDLACQRGALPNVINTVPSYASVFFGGYIWVFVKFVHFFFCFFKLLFFLVFFDRSVVYRPINGGGGQIFDIAFILLVRIFRVQIVIHHHSFNYLNRRSLLFSILQKLSGPNSLHVVLGKVMAEKLSDLYDINDSQMHILSNVAFFTEKSTDVSKNCIPVIGHLSNLCVDKGIIEFVDLCKALITSGFDFQAVIAGPFSDKSVQLVVENAIKEMSQVKYLGPLYGTEKDKFFSSLDVFVFPSRYKNEAEPLVLYEAAEYGALTLGTQRGCMATVIKALGGESFIEGENVASVMSDVIQESHKDGQFNFVNKIKRIEKFEASKYEARDSLERLLGLLKVTNVSET